MNINDRVQVILCDNGREIGRANGHILRIGGARITVRLDDGTLKYVAHERVIPIYRAKAQVGYGR